MMNREAERWLKETILLYALNSFGPLSRRTLSRTLRVTEGVVKGMIKKLKQHDYVRVSRLGAEITSEGKGELCKRLDEMRIGGLETFPSEALRVGPVSVATLIRGAACRISSGLEERDHAVRAGALGAITVVYRDGVYSIPRVYGNLEAEAYDVYKAISEMFKPDNGDCILIVFGVDYWVTVEAAFSVALKILEHSLNC